MENFGGRQHSRSNGGMSILRDHQRTEFEQPFARESAIEYSCGVRTFHCEQYQH